MVTAKIENIEKWIDGMNQFNATPEFGTTRILFTKEELANRAYIKKEMSSIGLVVSEDSIGNIYATLPGDKPDYAPVWTGSHIDTVPNAGKFDGMAGVVCGLEALRMIKDDQLSHDRDITLVVYTSEEPTRFKLGCLGSRAMSGVLTLSDTKMLYDQSGRSLHDKLIELGYNTDNFDKIRRRPGDVYASVELHIEQSIHLEKTRTDIGIVTGICAPSNYLIEVTGCQSHAGGTSMEDRRDAYMAACEMALSLEKLAIECSSEYNTATIGVVNNIPGAVNVIPGKCSFTVDLRDCRKDTKDKLILDFKKSFEEIAAKRNVEVSIHEECNDTPLTCNKTICNMLELSCESFGYTDTKLVSGPYHDSLFVGRFAPTAMLFVPSKDGISHSPEEWTDYEALVRGTNVLADTLLRLANASVAL